jgi:hypothetical protein
LTNKEDGGFIAAFSFGRTMLKRPIIFNSSISDVFVLQSPEHQRQVQAISK